MSVADMAELAGCIEVEEAEVARSSADVAEAADNLRLASISLLLLLVELSSSSPHNRFISSSTRKKSSSVAETEAIEHAIRL